MTFRLILLISFIFLEPFLPVKAFLWSSIPYQFLLWLLLLGLFDWSKRSRGERFALAGIICVIFFRPSICGMTFPQSNSFYLLLVSGIFLISFFGKKDLVWIRTPLDGPIITFLILATGYMLLSIDRMTGLRQVISLWGAGIFYFILVREIKDLDGARNMLLVFFMAALRIMANGLHQFWVGFAETRIWIETYTQGELGARLLNRLGCGRVFSSFVYPNAYAGFLIMLIPVVFSFFWYVKGYKRIGLVSFMGLSFYSLYITYSKGGWLTLALVTLGAFFFLLRIRSAQKLFTLFLAIILIACAVFLLESTGSKKLGFIDSFKVRWEYWQAAFSMIRDNPFRGYGLGNFGEIYARYKLPQAEETQMAHNNYLQVWVEMGMLGIFILLWLVFNFVRVGLFSFSKDIHARSLSKGVFWGGAAFFIHCLVDFDFHVPNLLFCVFFLIGVLGALNGKRGEYILLKNPRPKLLYPLLGVIMFLGLLCHQTRYLSYLTAMERVKSLVQARQLDRADEKIEMLLDMGEFNPKFHFEKGRLNEMRAFKEKRKDYFTRAIYEYSLASNLNPHRAGYHYSLGRLYWVLRDDPVFFKKAISEFKLAHEAYPTKKQYKKVLQDLQQYEK